MTAELRFTTSGYAGASLPNTSTTSFRINWQSSHERNFVAERAVGESRRHHRAAPPPRPRRRGDRITTKFATVHESAFGTKRTCRDEAPMSAFGGKADMA